MSLPAFYDQKNAWQPEAGSVRFAHDRHRIPPSVNQGGVPTNVNVKTSVIVVKLGLIARRT
jgi:hypothetical protein